jgi:threonine dehydrogenase-like Zn-dependent dehydrogenase
MVRGSRRRSRSRQDRRRGRRRAVGLLGVLAAKQLGAERIIAMSRHERRQHLAREFGATESRNSRMGLVPIPSSKLSALKNRSFRRSGPLGQADTWATSALLMTSRFLAKSCSSTTSTCTAGRPVPRFLPELIDLIWTRRIDPGKVFDRTLPFEEVAEGHRAMDERRAIKTLSLSDAKA